MVPCCSGTATPRWWRRSGARRPLPSTRAPRTNWRPSGPRQSWTWSPRPSWSGSPPAAPKPRCWPCAWPGRPPAGGRAAAGGGGCVRRAAPSRAGHDRVRSAPAPPFHGPDTAGVPAALGHVVTVVPADAQALAAALRDEDVAAVILEPSGAAWGTVPLPAGLLAELRALTAATGTVLIFDEVVSGFRWSPGR